jgi:hypothetical protein
MKKIKYIFIMFSVFTLSCTENFEEINTDPNNVSAAVFNANYLLAQSQFQYSNTGYSQLLFQSMWPQALASTFSYYGNGDKYLASGSFEAYKGRVFEETYRAATLAFEMQNLVKDDPKQANLFHIGTIMKVLCIARLTDTYGDVPYTEALRAKEGITLPKYDDQSTIYPGMLAELEKAVAALNASSPLPTNDLMYKGDISKWKKFGNSLMLRLAMRLVKVDPAAAKTWAEKAATGGVFTSVDDNAKVITDATSQSNNTTGALRVGDDYREVRWSKTLIDHLKKTSDPRISAIAEVSQPGLANNSNQDLAGDNSEAIQIGLPNGYDLDGGAFDISKHPQYPGASGTGNDAAKVGKYSRPRTLVFLDRSGVNFVLTFAETELLIAEAKVRGFSVGAGSAADRYRNGVKAAIASLAQFNSRTASDAAITEAIGKSDTYLAANALSTTSVNESLRQINEQIWIATATTFNFNETWNNWKRSGFPTLTPVVFPNGFSNGQIPRRVPYKISESGFNELNYKAAIAKLSGGDSFTARMWWDK